MNRRDRLGLVASSRFEEELCMPMLGIYQRLQSLKRLEIARPNFIGR
jgi:hypothetical protein